MRVLYSPTVDDGFRYEYTFNKETIKAELYEISMIDETIDEILVDTQIYDLSNVEADKEYTSLPEFIVEINRAEDKSLEVEVVSYVSSSETDEKVLFPEWQDAEFEDSEIPEDAEIIQLEEMVFPEPEPEPDLIDQVIAENKALEVRLESMKRQLEEDRKRNERTTLELLELMTELL